MRELRIKKPWEISAIFWVIAAIIAVSAVTSVYNIVMPVFLGLFLAYLFNPAVEFSVNKLKMPRILASFFILLIVLFIIALTAYIVIPLIIGQAGALYESAFSYLKIIGERYGFDVEELKPKERFFGAFRPGSIGAVGSILGTTAEVILWMILLPLFFFYYMWKYNMIRKKIYAMIPQTKKEKYFRITGRINSAIGRFFKVRLGISIFIGLLFSFGWFLVNVPYWFFLGMFTGILSAIPYLSTIGLVLVIIARLFQGGDWLSIFLWPAVVFWIVNIIEEWFLSPVLQGKTMEMGAMTLFVILLIGGKVAGFIGLLLSIPAAATIKILVEELLINKTVSAAEQGG